MTAALILIAFILFTWVVSETIIIVVLIKYKFDETQTTARTLQSEQSEQPEMSEEAIKEFKEADAALAKDAMNIFANLNNFMAGTDEEYNAEEQ